MSQQIQITGGAKVRDLQDVIIGTSGVLSSLAFNVANGVPKLDVNGKILVSQLPNSVMEYKGVWNAATNSPTLTNGGAFNQGDVYLCDTAGTVNFGSGSPISFIVGDQAIYSGSVWQKAGGATGTVTSVAVTESGDSLNITGSPITTSGTINIGFNGTNLQYVNGAGNLTTFPTLITSIGLSMPSAFSVANSPLTANGTIAVTGAGVASQYIRGDGTLADFPSSGGGGSSVSYYLNGGTSQGTIGGTTYYEMSKTADTGTGVDFPKTGDGFIVAFLTDANDPAQLNIPAGNWNYEIYAQMSSNGGTPQMYAELYKYDGTTFTLISTSSNEIIYDGTALNLYTFAMAVPETTLTLTDRLAVKLYSTNSGGKTTTIHTQNGHLCQIITTFSTGITALNGLTAQVQYFQTGTSGTDFNISSTTATHTFNIPDASATARGLITTGTQTIAGTKTFNDATKNNGGIFLQNASSNSLAGYMNLGGLTNGLKFTSGGGVSNTFTLPSATGYTFTFPNATGTLALTSDLTGGTVTSVAALTIGTSGTDLSSSVANSTTTPVITLNVPTASATNRGALSSADWTTFNNKQSALTNPVTGTGTTNYLPKFTGASTIGNSVVQEASGFIGIGVSPLRKLHVLGGAATSQIQSTGTSSIMYFGDASSTVIDNQGFGSIGNSLYLLAGGVERLYLTSTGNVGIGTANPLNRLFVTAATAGDYAAFIENTNSTNGYGLVARTAHTSSSAYAFAARAGATDIFIVRGDGRVGIGNTNPAYKLDVSGTGNFTGALSGTSATFSSTVTATAFIPSGATVPTNGMYLSAANTLNFATASTNRLTINSSGNVAIGSSSASCKLQVGDLANTSGTLNDIFITGDKVNADGYYSRLIFGNSTQSGGSTASIRGERKTSNFGTELTFYTNTNASAGDGIERMRINNTGIILIGNSTVSGASILQVTGAATFTGALSGTSASFSDSGTPILILNSTNGTGYTAIQINASSVSKAFIGFGTYLTTDGGVAIRTAASTPFTIAIGSTTPNFTIASTGAATFSSSATATAFTTINTDGVVGNFNSSNANGGYFTWQTSGTTIADIGTAQQIFGSGGNDTFGINGRGARSLVFGTNNTARLTIASTGTATLSADIILSAANPFVYGGTSVGGVGISNTSGSSYIKIYAASHATLANNIQFVNASSTSFSIASTGAAIFSSSVTATGFFESSDSRLKTLIQDNYQTKGIASITPKLYTKNGKVELGYYAQDFVGILDSAISKGSDDMLSLSYREVLVAKVYALEQEIKELKAKLN
jgi:hypothetical protein